VFWKFALESSDIENCANGKSCLGKNNDLRKVGDGLGKAVVDIGKGIGDFAEASGRAAGDILSGIGSGIGKAAEDICKGFGLCH
jgi:hypothetical protein